MSGELKPLVLKHTETELEMDQTQDLQETSDLEQKVDLFEDTSNDKVMSKFQIINVVR